MSPIYVYQCKDCGEREEIFAGSPPEHPESSEDCAQSVGKCDLFRVWTAPSIGMVDGAGFSPARGPVDK